MDPQSDKRIALWVFSILLVNPLTIYLLINNLFLVVIIFLISSFLSWLIIYKIRKTRTTLYFFNIIFIISISYHAELIFSLNYSEYVIPNLYQPKGTVYFNKPNIDQTFDDGEYITRYLTNCQGYRISQSNDPEVKVSECDWLFIGDSFTQGAQVNFEELYTSKIYDNFPNKIILNAGISGWGLPDYYNYYISEGYKFKPQKVFTQICIFNDFMNVIQSEIGLSEHLMEVSNLYRFIKYNLQYETVDELPLKRWTEPFYPTEQMNIDYNIFYKKKSERKSNDINEFKRYLKKLNEAVKSNGSELVVILIPTKEQIYYKCFDEVVSNFKLDVSSLNMKAPNELMTELQKESGFRLIDLYGPFIKEPKMLYYERDEHLNRDGHTLIANEISDTFKDEAGKYHYLSKTINDARYPTYFGEQNNILYQARQLYKYQIFTNDSTFSNEKILIEDNRDKIHPTLSKDRTQIAYTEGEQEEMRTKLIVTGLVTNSKMNITNNENEYGAIPAFSNRGDKIAFPSWFETNNKFSNPVITILDLITNEKYAITTDDKECWRPIFNPNDSIVYYLCRNSNENFIIKSFNLFSKETQIVLDSDYNIWDPSISADGKWIVYSGNIDKNWDLFAINTDTKEIRRLTQSKGDEWDPSFSNNGKSIIFGGVFGFNNGIYTIKF